MNLRDKEHPFWSLIIPDKKRPVKAGEFLEFLGSVCFFCGGVMFWANGAGGVVREMHIDRFTYWTIVSFLILFGMFSVRIGKKISQPTAKDLLQNDLRNPILYLRTFDSDQITGKFGSSLRTTESLESEEEKVISAFRRIGPVVAIGRPQEVLPNIGASRFYVFDYNWQKAVNILTDLTDLIILRIGSSCGLKWELKHTSELLMEGKLQIVLVVPHCVDIETSEYITNVFGLENINDKFSNSHGFRTIKGFILLRKNRLPFYFSIERELDFSKLISEVKSL